MTAPAPAEKGAIGKPFAAVSDASAVLVVDLDGTLIRSDLLHESLIKLLVERPSSLPKALLSLVLRGKARFKRSIAKRVNLDVTTLPYDPRVLEWIAAERSSGRSVVLCTASDMKFARAVATHLGLFDDVLASDGVTNLSAAAKAALLVERYGENGFDYAGNTSADLAVWAKARHAIAVAAPSRVRAAARRVANVTKEIPRPAPTLGNWRQALRLHQWAKNVLVFLPLFGAHRMFDMQLLGLATWAFVAFGLCASSVYLVNDLIDLESDRRHPRKRFRPFAAGKISVLHGAIASLTLAVAAFVVAVMHVTAEFTAWLAVYLGLTICYTFWLKRRVLVDSLVLAGLYTLRVLAGSAAVGVDTGFWLLAFSLFLFLSLAMVKRYSELAEMISAGLHGVPGRGYLRDDLQLVQSFGVASGFAAVVVLALYNNGETVARLYPHQQVVWLTVPILLYWICHLWLEAHRGNMHDDPVIFALKDSVSRLTIAAFIGTLLLASIPW